MSVLTFLHSSGTVSFDYDEVASVSIREVQKSSKQRLLNGAPKIYLNGNPYNEIAVNFRLYFSTTHPKIITLKSITDVMTMKLYASDSSLSEIFSVRIDPNITLPYAIGAPQYDIIQVGFIEATSGKAVFAEE